MRQPSLSGGNIDFTLVANVYLNNTANTFVIMDKSNNTNAYDYRLAYNSGTGFRFRLASGSAYVDSGAVSANAWHTVVAWYDSGNDTINIQVDNGQVNTLTYSTGSVDTTNPLSIGALPDGTYGLDGRLDDVAVYKRVLTSSERTWLYNNGMGRTYTDITATYAYDLVHKHAVKTLGTGESYTYDANGNMETRVENGVTYTQHYDAENRLISVNVTGQAEPTLFVYDGDGNLVIEIKPDKSRTLYVGGIYEVDKSSDGSVTGTKTYYPAAGAMRVDSTLYYVLKDHLGSASVVTNASGQLVAGANMRYYPFGEARFDTGPMVTDKLFTGQRQIAELGIYHYGARFYSPKLGRFLSADTIVPGYANPQNLNRFSYVTNNPLRYIDPTGHRPCEYYEGSCVSENQVTKLNKAKQEKIKEKSQNKEGSPACPDCIVKGAAIIVAMMPIELALGAAMIAAIGVPGGAIAELVLFPLEVAALNTTLIGLEFIAQGQNRSKEEIEIDYFPIIPTSNHLFNPNIWK